MAEGDRSEVTSGERGLASERGRRGSEEEVYTLLFQEVDKDGSGLVGVASLVEFLEKMQLGTTGGHSSGVEDVYDSHQDVHQIKYNLELLKAMLKEVSGESGLVDEAKYSRVIRLWVKDVRVRGNQQQALEVARLSSDSEDNDDDGSMTTPRPQLSFEAADQSFETSGGNSSTHSGFDMLASLEDEKRRLLEKERQLQASLDHTEEQLRGLQTENSALLSQIQGFQQQRVRLEALESQNTAILQALRSEESKCQHLQEEAQRMSQQMSEAQREASVMRDHVSEVETERERDGEEATEVQQRLAAKEELLSRERERQEQLQEQLSSLMAEQATLRSKVTELEKNNVLLQRENEELHGAAATVPTVAGPPYSTPARPTDPPSLHEEISRHGNLSGPSLLSPLVGIDNRHGNKESCRLEDHYDNSEPSLSRSHGNLTLEDLDHIAQNSSNKFHSKTEVIVKLLSELTAVSPSYRPHFPSHSTDSITELSHSRTVRDTSNMRQLVTCVKKLYSEKKKLRQQVAELQAELAQRVTEDVDAAVQTVATPPAETTPLVPHPVDRTCGRLVGGVIKGVVWALCFVVMVILLLATLVWLHEHLAPCCHGNLTPGGMLWAIMEPQVTVTHHGYI